MRGRQESPLCQYIFPDARRCNAPLSGRGRYKWCKRCEDLVRREKQRLGSAEWQQVWRGRHPDLHKSRTWIYRRVKKVEKKLTEDHPGLDPKLIHRTLQRAFLDAFQETDPLRMRAAAVALLPNGFLAVVSTNFDPEWQPVWNRVWAIDLLEWPVPFRANGKEFCFLISVNSQEDLFLTLCKILGSVLENGAAAKGRATVLYMPQVKKATGTNFLFSMSELLPGWKAASPDAKQIDGSQLLKSEYYHISSVNLTRAHLVNIVPVDIWNNESFLASSFLEIIDQVVQEQNAEELRVALSRGVKVLRETVK